MDEILFFAGIFLFGVSLGIIITVIILRTKEKNTQWSGKERRNK